MRLLLAWLPLLVACGTLVPRATPRMSTGHPLEGRGQLTIGVA